MSEIKMGKACLLTNGCPENQFDSARVRLYLSKNGWQIVEQPADADLILFNACGLTKRTADHSMHIIRYLQKQTRSGAQLIVWGCLPKIDPDLLRQVYRGPTFGEAEIDTLDNIIDAKEPINGIVAHNLIPTVGYFEIQRPLKTIANLPLLFYQWYRSKLLGEVEAYNAKDASVYYIKVATGCPRKCSYCAVRNSRGGLRSKSIEKVLAEFKDGLSQGFSTFSLLGTNLGYYGMDIGSSLCDLLKEVVKEDGQYQIALRNVYPGALIKMLDDLKPILMTGKIWYMEIPAESGSDRILKLMKRDNTVEELKECVRAVRQTRPDIRIVTQLMVGFPTETKQDFAASMKLLDELDFDFVEIYQFSPRPNTSAEQLEGQIPNIIGKYRLYRMLIKELLQLSSKKLSPVRRLAGDAVQTDNNTSRLGTTIE